MPKLTVVNGLSADQAFEWVGNAVIGRAVDCPVRLLDPTVSRRHAAVSENGSDFLLIPIGGTNQTLINGRPIKTPTKLREGDIIQLGEVKLRYTSPRSSRGLIPQGMTVAQGEQDIAEIVNKVPAATTVFESKPETQAEIERLGEAVRTLHGIAQLTAGILEPEVLIEGVLSRLLVVFRGARRALAMLKPSGGAKDSTIFALTPGESKIVRDPTDVVISGTVLKEALQHRSAVLSRDISADQRFAIGQSVVASGARALLCTPLLWQQRTLGLLYVDSALLGAFNAHDLELFSSIGVQVSLALAAAGLHQELLEKQQIEQDLATAERIQQSFLPQAPPELPNYEVAVHYAPARGVSGDYYDWVKLGSGATAFIVADVAGKGLGAAMHMARLTRDLRHAAIENSDPAEICRALNRAVLEVGEPSLFITMLLVVLDPESGELRFTNAGHFAPRIRHAADGDLSVVDLGASMPLGMFDDAEYQTASVTLGEGDTLFMFSDGLVEAQNPHGQLFGEDALGKVIATGPADARSLLDRAIAATEKFLDGEPAGDDRTALALYHLPNAKG